MPVLGFVFDQVEAKRIIIKPGSGININSKLDVKTMKILRNNEWGEFLEVEFEFNVSYNNVRAVSLRGRLAYNTNLDKIKESLEKQNKLPKESDVEIKNFLLAKCLLFASQLCEKLGMPLPIPMPTIGKKEERSIDYIG